jgi:hypothetical protein
MFSCEARVHAELVHLRLDVFRGRLQLEVGVGRLVVVGSRGHQVRPRAVPEGCQPSYPNERILKPNYVY